MIRPTGALGLSVVSEGPLVNADAARVAAGGFSQIVESDAARWPRPGDLFARASQRPGERSTHVVALIVLTLSFSLITERSLIDTDVLVSAYRRLCEVVEFNAGCGPLGLGDRYAKCDESNRRHKQRRRASDSRTFS